MTHNPDYFGNHVARDTQVAAEQMKWGDTLYDEFIAKNIKPGQKNISLMTHNAGVLQESEHAALRQMEAIIYFAFGKIYQYDPNDRMYSDFEIEMQKQPGQHCNLKLVAACHADIDFDAVLQKIDLLKTTASKMWEPTRDDQWLYSRDEKAYLLLQKQMLSEYRWVNPATGDTEEVPTLFPDEKADELRQQGFKKMHVFKKADAVQALKTMASK